jgi:hypothetical protein
MYAYTEIVSRQKSEIYIANSEDMIYVTNHEF